MQKKKFFGRFTKTYIEVGKIKGYIIIKLLRKIIFHFVYIKNAVL